MRQSLADVSPSPASPELNSLLSSGLATASPSPSGPVPKPVGPSLHPHGRSPSPNPGPPALAVVRPDSDDPSTSSAHPTASDHATRERSTLVGALFGAGSRRAIIVAGVVAVLLGLITSGSLGILPSRGFDEVQVVSHIGRRAERIDVGDPGQITVAWDESGAPDSLVLLETELADGWSVLDDGRDEQKEGEARVFGLDVLLANGDKRVDVVVVLQDGLPVVRKS